jgi:hypothetical protein
MSKSSLESLKKDLEANPFPITTLDPSVKVQKGYGLAIGKHIDSRGRLEDYTSDRKNIIQENRDYAAGRQDINKYKPLLDAEIDNKGDSSYMNIDWSIQTPGKKYVDTIVGDMVNQDHKIQFNAIDNYSKQMLKKARDEYYGKIARRRDVIEMEQMSGMVMEKRDGFNPGSKEEVDVYMDMEFKQAVEIGMESIVDFELENNGWDFKVSKRVIRDLVENNKGCVRLFYDRNGKISFRYVNIANYYASGTDEPDHDDTEYQAEKVMMSIRNLRERDVHNEITEKQWYKIAKTNSGRHGNASWRFGNSYDSSEQYEGMAYSYSDYRVEVLDFVFYTTDGRTYSEKEDKFGGSHLSKKNHGYQKPERSKRKISVHNKELKMSYEGIFIPGSEILLGYERTKNILRPQTKDGKSISPELLRRFVYFEPNLRKGTSTSFVDTIKPNLDTIQLLVLRKRHVIAEMNPTGVAIDVSGLSDVMSALEETDPLKIVKLYKQKGVLFFSRTDVNGDPVNGVPIQELGSQFAQSLIAIDNAIINEIEHIRSNGGINDARDGSSPDKDALVGIEKMRLLASNNTTRETYKAYTEGIFARVGKVLARMIQYKVAHGGGISEYDNIIGEQGVKSIEFAKSVTMAQMGIKVEALPTDDEIEALLNIMNVALQSKEIRLEDYLEIKRIPNIKKAERLLIYRKKVYAEEKMEEFRQKEEITGEREQKSAMAAAEAEKLKSESRAAADLQVAQGQGQLDKDLVSHETLEKMKILNLEFYHKQELLKLQIEGGDGDAVDKPRISQNPEGAVSRVTAINP